MRPFWRKGDGGLLVVVPSATPDADVAAPIKRLVYVAGGRLRSLTFSQSGVERVWERKLPGALIGRDASVVVAMEGPVLTAFDLTTGDPIWSLTGPDAVVPPLMRTRDGLILAAFGAARYCLFETRSGKRKESGEQRSARYAALRRQADPLPIPPPQGPTSLGELTLEEDTDDFRVRTPDGRYVLSISGNGQACAYRGDHVFWRGRL